jgi:single-strand DNA-binding protein
MSHTVTAKLNQAARQHQGQAGTTFFVSLGEKNYDFKNKTNTYTNYDAALFAKDAQVGFYASALVEGAIVSVTGSGIILDDSNKEYKPKLAIQDAKLEFVHSPQGAQQVAPQTQGGFQQSQQQYAPQQQAQVQYQSGQGFQPQQPPQQQGGYQNQPGK